MTTPGEPGDPYNNESGNRNEPPGGGYPPPPGGFSAGGPPQGGFPAGGFGNQAPPGYGPPGYGPYGRSPQAPYGIHPVTGVPYSDKSKLIAGLLQILIPLGIGRFYSGHTSLGVGQLLVTIFTCGIGAIWPFIDGILILVGDPTDAQGRPLREGT